MVSTRCTDTISDTHDTGLDTPLLCLGYTTYVCTDQYFQFSSKTTSWAIVEAIGPTRRNPCHNPKSSPRSEGLPPFWAERTTSLR
jgi:hypothetical protein